MILAAVHVSVCNPFLVLIDALLLFLRCTALIN